MREVKIVDISLRENDQLSFKQKIEMAKLLEKLKADVLETGYISEAPADAVLVRTLSTMLDHCEICVPVSLEKQSADRAAAALSKAKKARLNLVVPTSTVQMEYVYKLKTETVLGQVKDMVAYCASLCPRVEFTAEDATRSEPEFLAAVVAAAVEAGAAVVTLCDSTGEKTPGEIVSFLESVRRRVPALGSVTLSLYLKDNLGLAAASAIAAVDSGVGQLKASCVASSANLPLEQLLSILKVRGEALDITHGINVTALYRTCRQLDALTGGGRPRLSPYAAPEGGPAAEEPSKAGDILSADADIASLRSRIEYLGYEVSEEDLHEIFRQFKEIARSKKVDDRDIEALVAETAGQVTPSYILDNYVINSGSAITATAFIRVIKDGAPLQSISIGDGPIDAAFRAVEQMLGRHYEMDDFQIHAVTEGHEAMGDALVKLRSGGKLYSGRGLSTDIVGASIRAYLSAVNKIVCEEQSV